MNFKNILNSAITAATADIASHNDKHPINGSFMLLIVKIPPKVSMPIPKQIINSAAAAAVATCNDNIA